MRTTVFSSLLLCSVLTAHGAADSTGAQQMEAKIRGLKAVVDGQSQELAELREQVKGLRDQNAHLQAENKKLRLRLRGAGLLSDAAPDLKDDKPRVDGMSDEEFETLFNKYRHEFAYRPGAAVVGISDVSGKRILGNYGKFVRLPCFDPESCHTHNKQQLESKYRYARKRPNRSQLLDLICGVGRLAEFRVGQYGRIKYCTVVSIQGPEDMIVTNVDYVPEHTSGGGLGGYAPRVTYAAKGYRKPMKLTGFSTAGLVDDMKWHGNLESPFGDEENAGAVIAIVGTYKYHGTTIINAVPLDCFRKGVTKEQFAELLKTGIELGGDHTP